MYVINRDSLPTIRYEGAKHGPTNTPHKFTNIGDDVARLICIHASPTVSTEWLE
jgi:hypothetical protein